MRPVPCALAAAAIAAMPAVANAQQPRTGLYANDDNGNYFFFDTVTRTATIISTGGAHVQGDVNPTGYATEIEFPNSQPDASEGIAWHRAANFTFNTLDFLTGLATSGAIPTPPDNAGRVYTGLEYIDGLLYGWAFFPGVPLGLEIYDPDTNTATPIGPGIGGAMTGLAYEQSTGTLYGVTSIGNLPPGTGPGWIVTIDLATGAVTPIGATGVGLGSIEFGLDGVLYGTGGQGLEGIIYTVNTATGLATPIADISALGIGRIPGLALYRPCIGDIDGDADTDVFDFGLFSGAFGSFLGDPDYSPAADLDNNGAVDVFDFGLFSPDFGCGTQ